jgi:valyl-tRNA synthetase
MEAIVEARRQFLYMLQECMIPAITQTFVEYWHESPAWNKSPTFRTKMLEISEWSDSIVDSKTQELKNCCDNFDKLIEASIVSLVRIMTSVKTKSTGRLKLTMPTCEEFVRKVYKVSATEVLKTKNIMEDEDTRDEKIGEKISRSIDNVIMSYVPIKTIVNTDVESEEELEEVQEPPEEEKSISLGPPEEEEEDGDLLLKN